MKTFLLWRDDPATEGYYSPEFAAARFGRIFGPFYRSAPKVYGRAENGVNLLYQELPVRGWTYPFVQEDQDRWALAIDYPVDAPSIAAMSGESAARNPLPALCAQFERNPRSTFAEVTPPSSLVWHNKRSGSFFAANDALGFSQLYEFSDGKRWALTNRISSFAAIGLQLEPDLVNWMARWAINFFPLERTGFKHITSLAPGSLIEVSKTGIKRTVEDLESEWVREPPLPEAEILERARLGMRQYIGRAASQMESVTLNLSGGWDSRPVGAVLRSLGVDFCAQTRGEDWRPDVTIAKQLCHIAGIPLKRNRREVVPPTDEVGIEDAICDALIWQSGFRSRRHHHTFKTGMGRIAPGQAVMTGRSGELCRHTKLNFELLKDLPERNAEDHIAKVILLSSRTPKFFRKGLHDEVRDQVLSVFRRGKSIGLSEVRASHYYVYHRLKSHYERYFASEPNIVITPYFHRDIVVSGFSLPFESLASKAVHRHIVAKDAPDWAEIEYENELTARLNAGSKSGLAPGLTPELVEDRPEWLRPVRREQYNIKMFWENFAEPAITAAIDAGGAWTEVYEPDAVRAGWQKSPEEFLVLALLPRALERLYARIA